jgi:hypothetical protein
MKEHDRRDGRDYLVCHALLRMSYVYRYGYQTLSNKLLTDSPL